MKNAFVKRLTILLVVVLTVSLAACSMDKSGIDDVKRTMPVEDEEDYSLSQDDISDYESVELALADKSVKAISAQELQKMKEAGSAMDNILPNGETLKENWRELFPGTLESKMGTIALNNNSKTYKTISDVGSFVVEIDTSWGKDSIKLNKFLGDEKAITLPKTPDDLSVEFIISPDGKKSIIASNVGIW